MKTFFIYFCKYISSPFIKNFFLEKVEGKENIPKHSNFILAPNHLDGKDHWFIITLLKERLKDVRFVGAMDSLKTLFMSGALYYLANTIKVNRKNVNRKDFMNKLARNLKENKIIIIYPEGDSNNKKNLLKGKTGIAELALMTGVPVIPMGIKTAVNSFKRIIKIGKPLHYSKERENMKLIRDNEDEYRLLLRNVTNKIMQEISKLSQKPYPYED